MVGFRIEIEISNFESNFDEISISISNSIEMLMCSKFRISNSKCGASWNRTMDHQYMERDVEQLHYLDAEKITIL
jgi:hypothetical protein